jgi:hypothetical protein
MDARMTKRRNFSNQFKAAVVLEALRGDKTVQEIAAKRQLHLLPAGVCGQTLRGNRGEHVETSGD